MWDFLFCSMFYTYVLQSDINGNLYKGSTENLDARIVQHNNGLVNYTSKYRPWKLVYSEQFNSRAEAMAREKFFKSGKGREWLKQKLAM
jgi:putative endonuclease